MLTFLLYISMYTYVLRISENAIVSVDNLMWKKFINKGQEIKKKISNCNVIANDLFILN